MTPFTDDELFDRQLREATPYIEDDGFTARVVQALPATSRARQPVRASILLAATVIASVVAYFVAGGQRLADDWLGQLTALPATWLLAISLSTGVVVGIAGLIAAWVKMHEPDVLAG